MPVIPALRTLRQEDFPKVKASSATDKALS